MKISKLTKLLQSWQVFNAVKEELGLDYLYHLWGYRNARQILRWCADPRRTVENVSNPIDKLQLMLEDLNRLGYREIALSAIKCLARPLGFEVRDPREIEPEKDCYQEFLDIIKSVGVLSQELQKALEDEFLEEEEKIQLLERIDETIKELMQFRNAIKFGEEEKVVIGRKNKLPGVS